MSKAKIQTLPAPTQPVKRVPRNALFPSAKSLARDYGPHAETLQSAMRESMVYGLCFALDEPYSVDSSDPFTERMLAQHMGRGFWSWEDVGTSKENRYTKLSDLASRRSGALPTDMRCVSPRLAVEMLLTSPTAVGRLIGVPVELILGLTGYGALQDARLIPLSRMAKLPTRQGYSQGQTELLEKSGITPFAAYIAQYTGYTAGLGRQFLAMKEAVIADCVKVYQAAGASEDIDVEWLSSIYSATIDELMQEPWHLTLPNEPDEESAQVILKRLLIIRLGAKSQFTGQSLMALGELTGISPSAFVRYAVKDLHRRGETYITKEEVLKMAESARGLLADELTGLAAELAFDPAPLPAQILYLMQRAITWKNAAPEWGVGRLKHQKALLGFGR